MNISEQSTLGSQSFVERENIHRL